MIVLVRLNEGGHCSSRTAIALSPRRLSRTMARNLPAWPFSNGAREPKSDGTTLRLESLNRMALSRALMVVSGTSVSMKRYSRRSVKQEQKSQRGRRIITKTDHIHLWATLPPTNTPQKRCCKNWPHETKNQPTKSPIKWRRLGSQIRGWTPFLQSKYNSP